MDDDLSILGDDAITIHTGFPNPALDRLHKSPNLDLNKLLIAHPSSTYLFQIHGQQWEANGIFNGDIALIDRVLEPRSHDLVVCWQASGFIVCRNDRRQEPDSFWGVISAIIHQYDH
jgi:DNA polymerase V